MRVLVVYCHPCEDSFTYMVKESFIRGLAEAGHSFEVSDLYAMRFDPVLSEAEYRREAFYDVSLPVPGDIEAEQEKIEGSDAVVFIYPDFWTAPPAMLEGWFQRVLTFGYAYGPDAVMKTLDKALYLITMGGSLTNEVRRRQLDAMTAVMTSDRFGSHVRSSQVEVFDEMTRGYSNTAHREENMRKFLDRAYELGRTF